MRPLKLTMQAFGSYGKKSEIDFTRPNQNLFLITGTTGSGKSTIFDAIVFALYGEASSSSNKKDGVELQSDFVSIDTEPFVELSFSEHVNGIEQHYTVRRVPAHLRPRKRGTGRDQKESESVSLTMPDGTEYPQKETDKKLEEIVGLTKSQFMQVAMIAQGEFVELLRADSNKKKEIFRKLFSTAPYQQIVDELIRRRREKQGEMEKIHSACQAVVRNIVLPDDFDGAGTLSAAKESICTSDHLNIADMEALLPGLEELCSTLKARLDSAGQDHEKASALRDKTRDAYHQGCELLRSFEQLEKAQQELDRCAAQDAEMQAAAALSSRIGAAYEIRPVWQMLTDARRAVADTAGALREQEEQLPALSRAADEAVQAEQLAKARQAEELAVCSRVEERVQKALALLEQLDKAAGAVQALEQDCRKAETAEQSRKKALTDFETQEQQWRRQSQELVQAGALLAQWESRHQKAGELSDELQAAQKLLRAVTQQKAQVEQDQDTYVQAQLKYEQKDAEYRQKNNAFLDAQAGFIARERLRPGCPCPVCGALEHPQPCVLSDEHRELTREMLDALAQEASALDQKRTAASAAAHSARKVLDERSDYYKDAMRRLRDRMNEAIPGLPEMNKPSQLAEALHSWSDQLDAEEGPLRRNAQLLEELQKKLEHAESDKLELRRRAEEAAAELVRLQSALSGARAQYDSLCQQKDFDSRDSAEQARSDANARKAAADRALDTAAAASLRARSAKDKAVALIRQFREALPAQQRRAEEHQSSYDAILAEKGLTEEQWQAITGAHKKAEAEELQQRIREHSERRATAAGARSTAIQAIGMQKKPEPDALRAAMNAAEEALKDERARLDRLSEMYRADRKVLDELAPRMQEQARLITEASCIESLYGRLGGKVSGARMDIETFVQRYYLRRVLHAANRRFQDMSAGQFELRMIDEEQAGEGKNRGLDLMVYSTVTGKEREVRTLSGGESFMAALSLALGMADQIQASSTAIHLDMMFIDEGFGSLDAHSRDQAVKVLQQMAGGDRLIGIISHVTELKQSIEDQLLVRKDENGSHSEWLIS